MLIDRGAALDHQTEVRDITTDPRFLFQHFQSGNTCLHFACLFGRPTVVSLLLDKGRGVDLETRNRVCPSLSLARFHLPSK
jgi:ankyrin repeat protein